MSRVDPAITAFNAGELSPYLFGRVNSEFEPRNRGMRSTLNMQALVTGPCVRRGGTRLIAPIGDEDNYAISVKFEFSETQAYVLEFGNQTMRVFKDKGQVLDGAGDPVEIATPWTSDELDGLYFQQSADVLFVCHDDHKTRTITRTSHVDWTLEEYENTDGPYRDGNGDEDLTFTVGATTGTGISLTATGHAPFTSDCIGMHVRMKVDSEWGWGTIASVTSSNAATIDIVDDFDGTTATPDWLLGAWSDETGWPQCMGIHEDAVVFGPTRSEPQTFWKSMAGDFYQFDPTESDGTVADDNGVTITIGSEEVNYIRGIMTGNRLTLLTMGGEWRIKTTSDAPLTPDNGGPVLDSAVGSARVQPIRVGPDIVFVQRQGKRLYSMRYSFEYDSMVPTDITQLSEHLTAPGIKKIAFAREPNPTIWALLNDGSLVSITYDPMQKVIAPTPHEIAGSYGGADHGFVESICVVPGDGRDELHMIVKREIDGQTRRYMEVMEQYHQDGDDQADDFYVDSGLTYDGRNTDTDLTFTVSATNYTEGSNGTITATGHAPFTSDSVGHVYSLQAASNSSFDVLERAYRVEITGFTSSNACACELLHDFPTELQATATPNWGRRVTTLTGLDHLEGETVASLANGRTQPDEVVADGSVTLRDGGEVIHVGLPYQSYMAPMRLDAGNPAGTAQGKPKAFKSVLVRCWETGPIQAGSSLDDLDMSVERGGVLMDLAPNLFTGDYRLSMDGGWKLNQDVFVVQDKALPMMVLGIYPEMITATG